MNSYIIKKLKEGRVNAKLKQSEVAEMIGIKGNTLSNYENGVSEPDIDTFCALCEIYNIDPSNILNEAYGLFVQGEDFKIRPSEIEVAKKYRNLDDFGRQRIDYELGKETERVAEIRRQKQYIESLKSETSVETFPTRIWAYYGKIASAGTSVEFADMVAGTKEYPVTEENKNADYTIGVNGDSMEPLYSDGDVVFVKNTTNLQLGDIGIFQKDNNIYIKQVGENCLVSLNPNYDPLKIGDGIRVWGKVLGKAVETD